MIKKTFAISLISIALLMLIGAVFAVPWNGLSYFQLWCDVRSGNVIYSGSRTGNVVAMTFDDGPDPRYTPRVLDILKRHKVHATFFVCGNMVQAHPDLLKRIVREGHIIGNHTETHPHLEKDSMVEVTKEIDTCQAAIMDVIGKRPNLFRCPRGYLNGKIVHAAISHGYKLIQWSIAFDRVAEKNSVKLRDRIVNNTKPGDIILMHDGSSLKTDERAPTLRELDGIISGLSKRGMKFATIPDLIHETNTLTMNTASHSSSAN